MSEIDNKKDSMNNLKKNTAHFILLHSYLIFFVAIIFGVFFDIFINKKIFSNHIYGGVGIAMLLISSLLIYWAQSTSGNYKEGVHKSFFERGPYKYMRSPTHLGLFIMSLGFSLIINSLFSVIFTIIAYIITKVVFLRKEEDVLEKKYGQVYTEYKKKVKNWI